MWRTHTPAKDQTPLILLMSAKIKILQKLPGSDGNPDHH